MTPAYTVRIGLGIGLISAALIQTEVLLTRLLSVVVWYHFAFVAISVALLGLSVAAVIVHAVGGRLREEATPEYVAYGAAATAVAIILVDVALLHATPDWFGTGAGVFTRPTFRLGALFLLAALPFTAGGFSVALSLSRWSTDVHRLYFWDLVGAGAGGASVVPLLSVMPAPIALLVPAVICGAAALTVVTARGRARSISRLAIAAPLALLLTAPFTNLFEIRVAKGVSLARVRPEYNRWNSFSMVTVLPQAGFRGWAPSNRYTGPIPEQKALVIDMNAMTVLTKLSGAPSELAHLSFDLSAFVYRVRPKPERACVLGAGAGRDVLSALGAGAAHVTAVEINPLIVDDVVRGRYRAFTGDLYRRPDVTVAVEDGRSFVARSDARWNVVQLSMVDTSAATAAGAYALTENSLYTREAFVELLRHLEPAGVLSVGSVSLPELAVGARLTSVARSALESLGRDPARSIAVIAAPWASLPNTVMYDVLVAPDGFDAVDRERILAEARALGFVPVYVPGQPPTALPGEPRRVDDLASAQVPSYAGALDVSPTTDDRPFFFYQSRLSDLGRALTASGPEHLFGNGMAILAKLLLLSAVLSAVLAFLPLIVGGARIRAGGGSVLADGAYAACLGVGFMFVEIGLLLRSSLHLGHPAASLTVVLLVLLVAGGVGSLLFARERTGARAASVLAAVIALTVAFAVVSQPLFSATRTLSGGVRALIVGLAILPLGLVIGAPLPLALGAVSTRAGARIPWLWAVNGATSVLASVLATLVGLHFGVRAVLIAGAGFYALALLLSRPVMRRIPSG